VVVLENRVYVYNFADLRLIDAIDTCNNPKGLCALNPDGKDSAILVTPASQKGFVRIAFYNPHNSNNVFKAHDNAIEAMALSKNGDILATASETGTIIRLYRTEEARLSQTILPFQEVRRGSTNANIHSLIFDNAAIPQYLACSSDRDTIHIFVVESNKDQKLKNPTGNLFQKLAGNDQQKSFAQYALTGKNMNPKCAFSEDGKQIIIVTQTGHYYEVQIDEKGGIPKTVISQKDLLNTQGKQ